MSVVPPGVAELAERLFRESAPPDAEHIIAPPEVLNALKDIWSQRRLHESRSAGPYIPQHKPFFPPHLTVARGRR